MSVIYSPVLEVVLSPPGFEHVKRGVGAVKRNEVVEKKVRDNDVVYNKS